MLICEHGYVFYKYNPCVECQDYVRRGVRPKLAKVRDLTEDLKEAIESLEGIASGARPIMPADVPTE